MAVKISDETVLMVIDRLVQEIGINNTISVPAFDRMLVEAGMVHDEASLDIGSPGRTRRNQDRAKAREKINRLASAIDTPFKVECIVIGETYMLEAIEVNAIMLAERRTKRIAGVALLGDREVDHYLARHDLHAEARVVLEQHKRNMRNLRGVIEVFQRGQEHDSAQTRRRLNELAREGRMILPKE